jgi:acyl transferase domain-containing protein
VAVVGMACRLPGAPDVDAFWRLLVAENHSIRTIPRERFDVDVWYDPVPGRARRIVSRCGGFLDDIERFDADFFGISPYEAVRLDPQQRLLLQTVWEALEDAGIPRDRAAACRTGVYASCLTPGYWDRLRRAGMYDLHAAMGGGAWGIPAGRISYHLDLRGPSMAVEGTCGTSMLAVHVACRGLWSGETDLAIVAAANVLHGPDMYFPLSEAEVLSPTGRCRFGDVRADGYVRSEGVVAVVLKPLTRAVADGDRIHAAILGTAASNDGRSGGTITRPGLEGQEAALRAAYHDAGVRPGDIDYVEAHGTGTPTGDPIELAALCRVLGEGRTGGGRCLIGSAKSNVGHTEIAAGLTGLIKTVLALRHRTIPATLHVDKPAPVFDEPDTPIELTLRTQAWPARGRPALAGATCLSLTGTNVHVVLSEVPAAGAAGRPDAGRRGGHERRPVRDHRGPYLLPVSARAEAALRAFAGRYADLLDGPGAAPDLLDVCFTAGARRTQHEHRLAVLGEDRAAIVTELHRVAAGDRRGRVAAEVEPGVAFVFPGQGSQWVGMGRELLAASPVFAAQLEECARAVEAELGWSPAARLRAGRPLSTVEEIQPTLWAMAVALAAVWRDWGIEPDVVIGHSMGEIAAATVAGALTVGDAAAVVCRRSTLIGRLGVPGAMWAVQLAEPAAHRAIGDRADRVCVGVLNSEHSVVLSGDPDALAEVIMPLREQGVPCHRLPVSYASHAPQVEPLRADLLDALARLRPRGGSVPIQSTVSDELVDGSGFDAEYWMANLRRPVRFAQAIRAVLAGSVPAGGRDMLFVEISPHALLIPAVEEAIEAAGAAAAAVPSLYRDRPELASLLSGLGAAYERGCSPRWERVYREGRHVPLPKYPWQGRRFRVDAPDRDQSHGAPGGPDFPPAPSAAGGVARPVPPEPGDARSAEARRSEITGSIAMLAGYLRECAARTLETTPDRIDPRKPLAMAGLDSVLAAKLRARVLDEIDLRISARDLLIGRPLADIAAALYDHIHPDRTRASS